MVLKIETVEELELIRLLIFPRLFLFLLGLYRVWSNF